MSALFSATQVVSIAVVFSSITMAAERQTITARLANSVATVSPATLAKAQQLAAYILRQAGVDLAWQTCEFDPSDAQTSTCGRLEPARYWLYLENAKQGSTSHGMLGFTVVNRDRDDDLRVAGVYYPRLQSMAERFRLSEHLVLGAALAHEIGHMLGLGHTPDGVMAPSFERRHIEQAASGLLRFSSADIRQLRELRASK
jgi:hypothetical protein